MSSFSYENKNFYIEIEIKSFLPTRTGDKDIVNSPRSFFERLNGIDLSNGSIINYLKFFFFIEN